MNELTLWNEIYMKLAEMNSDVNVPCLAFPPCFSGSLDLLPCMPPPSLSLEPLLQERRHWLSPHFVPHQLRVQLKSQMGWFFPHTHRTKHPQLVTGSVSLHPACLYNSLAATTEFHHSVPCPVLLGATGGVFFIPLLWAGKANYRREFKLKTDCSVKQKHGCL